MVGIVKLGALALVGASDLSNIGNTGTDTPGIVRFPIKSLEPRSLSKRSGRHKNMVEGTMANLWSAYALQCTIGSPAQEIQMILDTGSSDSWVFSPETDLCQLDKCYSKSIFDYSKSNTFHSNGTNFVQRYSDGSALNGTWGQDVLSFGGTTIDNFNFAIASQSSMSVAIAGIGLPQAESPYILKKIDEPYTNLPKQLKSGGHIAHEAYSLYLESSSEATGSILFGAINTGAFEGDLYRFPMVPVDSEKVDRLAIKLQSIWVINDKGEQQKVADTSIPVILDSGSTLSALPEGLLKPFLESIGATYQIIGSMGVGIIACDALEKNHGGIGLTFGNVEFVVNFHDLLLEVHEGTCVAGFISSGLPTLGDNILRSLYVVYDLENKEIALAKANTKSSIKDSFKTISGTIPGKKAPGYSDSSVNFDFKTSHVTMFSTKHKHPAKISEDPISSDVEPSGSIALSEVYSSSAISTAHVHKTVGGKASQTGLNPRYSGDKSMNAAPNSNVAGLTAILLSCFSLLMTLI